MVVEFGPEGSVRGAEPGLPAQLDAPPAAPASRALLEQLSSLADPALLRLPLPDLLDQTLDRLLRIFRAEVAVVFLLDPGAGLLRPAAVTGIDVPAATLAVPTGAGLAGRVVALGEPLLLEIGPGTEPDPTDPDPLRAVFAARGVRCGLGVPLIAGSHVLGALLVAGTRTDGLSTGDIPVLSLAATHVALALDHGVLLDAERTARLVAETANERLERLQRLTAQLAGALTENDVVRTVISDGLRLLDAVAGAIWAVDGGDALRLTGSTGYPEETTGPLSRLTFDAPYPVSVAARDRHSVLLRSPAERDAAYPAASTEPDVGTAYAAVPLVIGDALVGVLSASFRDGERLREAADLEFLEAVAGQCAVALHRVGVLAAERTARRLEEEAVRRLGRLQAFTSRLGSASTSTEVADMTIEALLDDVGASRCVLALLDEERGGLALVRSAGVQDANLDRFTTMPLDHHLPAADAVLRATPIVLNSLAERDRRYPALAGLPPYHDHTLIVLPLLVEDDPVGSLSLAFPDVRAFDDDDLGFLLALAGQCAQAIERSRLREGQRRSRRQLALLAETGRLFATSLDLDATLEQVCRLLTPAIVDAAAARVLDQHGQLRLAAYALADDAMAEPLARLWESGREGNQRRLQRVIERGEPVLEGPLDPASYAHADAQQRADLDLLDLRSSVLVPLRARGRAIGILSTSTRAGRPPLTEADLPFLTELGARVALAVDNARLFRHQTEIAHTLQRSLLPAELPAVEGAEVAVSYLPGMEGTTVGGDFYDVITLPSGRVGLVIGDVMGRGVRAAAVMGQLRAAVRSYALEGHGPAALLARLDRLVTTLEEGLLVTCVYGEWDPQRAMVTLACAGHLPPLVRRPGAPPRFIECDPGVPLGVGSLSAVNVDVELPPGSLLLAYTDGIVESPALALQDGMAALARAVGEAPATAAEVCRVAVERLRPTIRAHAWSDEHDPSRQHDDDVALLAIVALDGQAGRDGSSTALHASHGGALVELPADASSPARARDTVASVLERWGMTAVCDTAVLLVSELVTNAVRHAGTALRLSVHRPSPGRVRVEVSDHAPHAPLRPRSATTSAEGGRGLFLVQALAAAWGSETGAGGKTVWFELDDAG